VICSGPHIIDDKGRVLILRGVNLGGSSKIPAANSKEDIESVSFVNRPFPPGELSSMDASEPGDNADYHFKRLKDWGFTFVRLVITWEALEHAGPGLYDESYIAYLRKILLSAEKNGISVYIDPHQDVWSRWTGGDGAPAWTLEKLGMDLDRLEAAGAAIITQKGSGKMIWPVNYSLYAAATMFTVFFAGNVFAPELKIDGISAQDWLQEQYMAAFRHCYRRLKNCGAVAGWGAMNEPHPGFIGYRDLRNLENAALAVGPVPNPFQAMVAASGRPVRVPVYIPWLKGWKAIGSKVINPDGLSLFKEGFTCPWKEAGVWKDAGGNPELLKPKYFSLYQGRPLRFTDDFLKPFILRFIEKMKEAERPMLFFIEGVPHGENLYWGKEEPKNAVNAFHYYDGATLFTKKFRPRLTADQKTGKLFLGKKKVAAFYSAKLAEAMTWTRDHMNGMPCLLGEFGLPFDLDNKKAYKTGDYSKHEEALSLYYNAIDENLLGSTIWNYTADNTHEDGDHWNGEDLSIVSLGDNSGKESGCSGQARAIGGWLRPYPMATAGIPLKFIWERKKISLYFRFLADPKVKAPTEIFLPSLWFGEKPEISIRTIAVSSSGEKKKSPGSNSLRMEYSREEQRLFIFNDEYAGEVEAWVFI